jgi:hypothetical protein
MGKKIAIGCLSVFALLAVAGGIIGYVFIYRPVQQAARSVQQFNQLAELERQVQNRSSFTPPADGVLTQLQLDRYLSVQGQMRAQLAHRVAELDAKYQEISRSERDPGFRELMAGYADLLGLVVEAKRAQVAALNQHNFSLQEYAWVRREVFRAAALPLSQLDWSELTGSSVQLPETTAVPEANIRLLAPYRDNLEEMLGLAFFGL